MTKRQRREHKAMIQRRKDASTKRASARPRVAPLLMSASSGRHRLTMYETSALAHGYGLCKPNHQITYNNIKFRVKSTKHPL